MANLSTKIELNISCKSLIKLDKFSDSDPCTVVEEKRDGIWHEIGRTEIIDNQCNPSFKKSFHVHYYFERVQPFRFRVYDWDDNSTTNLNRQELIGQMECNLSEIVGTRGQFKRAELVNPDKPKRKNGFIIVTAEEINEPPQYQDFRPLTIVPDSSNPEDQLAALELQIKETPARVSHIEKMFTFRCSGKHLDKKDLFGKSDPYFKIYRSRESQDAPLVFESEIIMKTLDPQWKEAVESLQKICNSDLNRPLKFEVWDWDKFSSHDLIGEFSTSISQILNGQKEYEIINPKKKAKNKNSGIFVFDVAQITDKTTLVPNPALDELNRRREELKEMARKAKCVYHKVYNPYTFVQYLAGGCEMSLLVAVDFTASNGSAHLTSSLHYSSASKPSDYVQAIRAVGNILADYDSDKKFPSFGFGGIETKYQPVSHCFPLNKNKNDPECDGIEGIVSAYHSSISTVDLAGPTNFASVIAKAQEYASVHVSQTSQKYFILLILTDGEISDKEATISAIVQASKLPLSIVIVGVGSSSFEAMDMLDADDCPLHDSTKDEYAVRDIVQFVPFNDYKNNPVLLAEKVLAEIPQQVTEFMAAFQIRPNPKVVEADNFVYGESSFEQQ